jgi:hypothetical protein
MVENTVKTQELDTTALWGLLAGSKMESAAKGSDCGHALGANCALGSNCGSMGASCQSMGANCESVEAMGANCATRAA